MHPSRPTIKLAFLHTLMLIPSQDEARPHSHFLDPHGRGRGARRHTSRLREERLAEWVGRIQECRTVLGLLFPHPSRLTALWFCSADALLASLIHCSLCLRPIRWLLSLTYCAESRTHPLVRELPWSSVLQMRPANTFHNEHLSYQGLPITSKSLSRHRLDQVTQLR